LRGDLRCADHPPDFADDGGLDHACRKALRAGVFACRPVPEYPSGEGRLYAEDVIVNIEGAAGTMIVSV
jgi:hypothetical protein